jgi:Ca-activated chloride channel family protein
MAWHELTAFHFLRPWWLLALAVAAAMAILALRALRSRSRWESSIDPELRPVLLERQAQRPRRLLPALVGIALAVASLALAGPTWQRLPQPVQQRTDALVIVLDLSLSMYAKDVPPSRLIAARHAVTDVLRMRHEGFTGLVAYAGDAHTVTPLTDDVATIENLLAALSPEMMPQLGSKPRPALQLARTLFKNAGLSQGRILLVTDGIARIGDVTAFADANFPISILGVGTRAGAPIPLDFVDQPGRDLTDRQGRTIVAKLDVDRLQDVATMCFGRYATTSPDDVGMAALLSTPLPNAEEERRINRRFDVWADYGYWLALALVPFALIGFRRGAVALVLCALLVPPAAHAGWWQDLWQRRDQQALQALDQGDPERAASLFENQQWRGVAQYRSADYAAAAKDFAAAVSGRGYYNRGNALAHQGKLEDAIVAYDQALKLNPNDEDAAFNKALLEKLLQQRKQQQASNENNGERQQNRDQSLDQQSRRQNSSANDQRQPAQSESGQSPQQQRNAERRRGSESESKVAPQRDFETARRDEARDETRDSLEQWLRRVPDDPSGLLRRKFQYETNERRRSGEATPADPDHIY